MHNLDGIVLLQSSWIFVRMFILIKSRPELKMGHVRSKSSSLGQFLEKPCVHSRGHSFDPVYTEFCRMFIFIKSRPELKLDHVESKTRSLG